MSTKKIEQNKKEEVKKDAPKKEEKKETQKVIKISRPGMAINEDSRKKAVDFLDKGIAHLKDNEFHFMKKVSLAYQGKIVQHQSELLTHLEALKSWVESPEYNKRFINVLFIIESILSEITALSNFIKGQGEREQDDDKLPRVDVILERIYSELEAYIEVALSFLTHYKKYYTFKELSNGTN
jgi:hypothetical protein